MFRRSIVLAVLFVVLILAGASIADSDRPAPMVTAEDLPIPEAIRIEGQRPILESATASDMYPYVTNVEIEDAVLSLAEDSLFVAVTVNNPSSVAYSGAIVTVDLNEPGSGYSVRLSRAAVELAPNAESVVDLAWEPDVPVGGLNFDVTANVSLPLKSTAADCENKITNGTFDGGSTGGWTLVNNLPPTLGAKATFGYLDVYSTIYNTEDRRAAQAYQPALFYGSDASDWVIQYRTKFSADDGIYGYGVAYTFIYFLGSDGGTGNYPVLGGYVQWASSVSAPPNTDSFIYDRTSEGVWHYIQEDVGDLMAGVTLSDTAVGLVVGATAMPYCPMPGYCTSTANAYLDDVAVLTCPESSLMFSGDLVVSELGSGIIGSREDLLRDCYGEEPSTLESVTRCIPYLSTAYMWEDFFANACAAGVYEDAGDDVMAGYALLLSLEAFMRPVTTQMDGLKLAAEGVHVTSISKYALDNLAKESMLAMIENKLTAGIYGESKDGSFADRLDALAGAAENSAGYQCLALADGPVDISFSSGGAVSDPDSLRHNGFTACCAPDSNTQWACAADSLTVLATGDPVAGSGFRQFVFAARDSGVFELGLVNRLAGGSEKVTFPTIDLSPTDILTCAVSDTATVYELMIDRSGDGTVDETVLGAVQDATGIAQGTTPPQRVLAGVQVAPNPFNPTTEIIVRHAANSRIGVAIYDSRGRLVRSLHDAVEAGETSLIVWDGRNDEKIAVPSGVYLAVVTGGEDRLVRKIACIR